MYLNILWSQLATVGILPVFLLLQSKVVEKDMRKLSIMEVWQRIENSRGNSYHVQP